MAVPGAVNLSTCRLLRGGASLNQYALSGGTSCHRTAEACRFTTTMHTRLRDAALLSVCTVTANARFWPLLYLYYYSWITRTTGYTVSVMHYIWRRILLG